MAFLNCGMKFGMVMVLACSRAFIRVLLHDTNLLMSLPLLLCDMVCDQQSPFVQIFDLSNSPSTCELRLTVCVVVDPSRIDLYLCRLALWRASLALPRSSDSEVLLLYFRPLFGPRIRTKLGVAKSSFPMHLPDDCWVWNGAQCTCPEGTYFRHCSH